MKKKKIVFGIMLLCFFISGCQKQTVQEESENKEVAIPVTFLVNPDTNQSDNQKLVEAFNEAYEGQYYLDVEWLSENASEYRLKIKQLNAIDKLPAIITDVAFDADFYDLLIKNNRLVDLRSHMAQSREWREALQKDILRDCMEEDGSIYLSPIGTPLYSYAGFIYNKSLLKQAGYESFPTTWEDFFVCLEDLWSKGITPLSLHGSGSYWVSMLMATSYCSVSEEGTKFLNQQFPRNYDNEEMNTLLNVLKKLFDYTYKDALDINYNEAEGRFFDKQAAIIANGPWMFMDLDESVQEQYGFSTFPSGTMIASPRMTAWAVTKGYSKEVTEGAIKFLEFRVKRNKEERESFLQEEEVGINEDYKEAIKDVKKVIPNYQVKWEQSIQNDYFTENMPLLLKGEVENKQFLQQLNQKVKEINKLK